MPSPKQVNIHEAKTHLSALIADVERGKEVVIARDGKPVARLVPAAPPRRPRRPGTAKGMITIHPSFFDPLPKEIEDSFYS